MKQVVFVFVSLKSCITISVEPHSYVSTQVLIGDEMQDLSRNFSVIDHGGSHLIEWRCNCPSGFVLTSKAWNMERGTPPYFLKRRRSSASFGCPTHRSDRRRQRCRLESKEGDSDARRSHFHILVDWKSSLCKLPGEVIARVLQ